MPLLVADPVIVAPAQREALEALGTSPLDLICLARIWKSAGRREHPLIDVQSLRVPLLPRIALGAVLLTEGAAGRFCQRKTWLTKAGAARGL
jgi:hypothetical protein